MQGLANSKIAWEDFARGLRFQRGPGTTEGAGAPLPLEKRRVGFHWPEEVGGGGGRLVEQMILKQECGRARAPFLGLSYMGLAWVGPGIIKYGTEEQKRRFIPAILEACEHWCIGYSEPGSGSGLASLRCGAVCDGDQYVISGQKTWTSLAMWSQRIILLVRTDAGAPPPGAYGDDGRGAAADRAAPSLQAASRRGGRRRDFGEIAEGRTRGRDRRSCARYRGSLRGSRQRLAGDRRKLARGRRRLARSASSCRRRCGSAPSPPGAAEGWRGPRESGGLCDRSFDG